MQFARKMAAAMRSPLRSNHINITTIGKRYFTQGNYVLMDEGSAGKRVPIKAWIKGVELEADAKNQLINTSKMPFIHSHIAVMPDVHLGKGSTIGTVIPTKSAIIPAAVGVDIGCGMNAVKTDLRASDLPDGLSALRRAIEIAVPHGGPGDEGSHPTSGKKGGVPEKVVTTWNQQLKDEYEVITSKHPAISEARTVTQLGTLGTGNHFIEICLDESDNVWIMLHSGSRGVGNKIGTYFIELARKDMKKLHINLPDKDLAYLKEGTQYFDDYFEAVLWAQRFAQHNRRAMMDTVISTIRKELKRDFKLGEVAVNCHHNYVQKEHHFGEDIYVTRKGAVRAGKGELGIIPGSMGAKSFIVRGLGNPESFESCSHGAGRRMSRTQAKKQYSIADHESATSCVECRKDAHVIDETPAAYKDIDAVIQAQSDLIEVVHTLKQILCVKG
eukprot:TRINITY_DN6363_c0_g1_i1.p1 TRINITY_DN6363_c0_g1~~TRINITY_DN6363_c0_g1_i1.p1  ORF type:complete len:443 (-),score=69.73 TRINITY_DN6363_c0_g1_i1:31-1359(-)